MIQREITDDLDALLDTLPPHICKPLRGRADNNELLEIVLDLGRLPVARYPGREVQLSDAEVTEADIDFVANGIGTFGEDNRAGIERTLHRISAMRNRRGRIVGLTCRVGRAIFGTIAVIDDLVQEGKSILLLGRPGVGKTTMLRETARVLADDLDKRAVIVDTSNEIAGDGDVPHPAIGRARRMQVPRVSLQHAVMIEAVENHMPEVIVIDEIGTELEAQAARTIAERGVQLVGTAHGTSLDNLILNPTLSDLIGGIQSVTLGDEEARRRGTQKSVLERKAPPTFDVVVEIQSWDRVLVHTDVSETVDSLLRGFPAPAEVRELTPEGEVRRSLARAEPREEIARGARDGRGPRSGGGSPWGDGGSGDRETREKPWERYRDRARVRVRDRAESREESARPAGSGEVKRVFPFGIARNRLEQAIRDVGVHAKIADSIDDADIVMTLRNYQRRKAGPLREAEERQIPIHVLRNNTVAQMEQSLMTLRDPSASPASGDPVKDAMRQVEDAVGQVMGGERAVDLPPANAYIRRLQHEIAQRFNVASRSFGRDPHRRVRIFTEGDHDLTYGLEG